jgi:hypothetical protein
MLIGDYTFLTVIALLFIINTIIQYRLGFKMGSTGGYSIGVYDTIRYLIKDKMIVSELNGKPLTAIDMSNYIISKSTAYDFNSKDLEKLKLPGE